jgi:hypothetical protein
LNLKMVLTKAKSALKRTLADCYNSFSKPPVIETNLPSVNLA